MKHIHISATLPGCGKTYRLCRMFVEADLQNKVILTPTNKVRQVCIGYLEEFGYSHDDALRHVKTVSSFMRNNVVSNADGVVSITKIECKPHTYKKVYNVFIDEVSLLSKKMLDSLTDNWLIENLVTTGDINQYKPIPIRHSITLNPASHKAPEVYIDDGKPIDTPIDEEIHLTKTQRTSDNELIECLESIKRGQPVLNLEHDIYGEITYDDIYIGHTNKACYEISQMLPNAVEYIVTKSFPNLNIWVGEVYSACDVDGFTKTQRDFFINSPKYQFTYPQAHAASLRFRGSHFSNAIALTSFSLQGSTISNKRYIFIDIDDYLHSDANSNEILRFLYTSASRAVSFKQLRFICSDKQALDEAVGKALPLLKLPAKAYVDEPTYYHVTEDDIEEHKRKWVEAHYDGKVKKGGRKRKYDKQEMVEYCNSVSEHTARVERGIPRATYYYYKRKT